MPVDYSKWDAIELSDDEDFECHPNVDKKSMIRWKQAQIHMKRKDLNDKIQALNLENEMSKRIIKLLQDSEINQDLTVKIQELNKEFEKKVYDIVMQGRNPQWDYPIPNEFLKKRIDLNQLSKEITPENKNSKIQELNARINLVKEELEKDEIEKSKKITSDTIKTGFDSSKISKKVVKEKVVETIHEPKNIKETVDMQENDDEKDYITYKPAENFAYLKGLDASLKALSINPELIGQKYSDEVLAEAFRLEMKGKSDEAFNCVQQSLILQYCGLLGKDGISLFFKRYYDARVNRAFNLSLARVIISF
jgi:cell division cycle protein 37